MEFTHPEHNFEYQLALKHLEKFPGSWILEIGSFRGDTALVWATAIEHSQHISTKSRLVCIDPFFGHYDAGLQKVLSDEGLGESSWVDFNKRLVNLRKWVIPIATTTEQAQELFEFTPPMFSLVFVDGDHSTAGAKADLEFASSLLCLDGVILCHDANWPSIQTSIRAFCSRYGFGSKEIEGGALEAIYC